MAQNYERARLSTHMRIMLVTALACSLLECTAVPVAPNSQGMVAAAAGVEKNARVEFTPEEEYLIGRAAAARILSAYRPYENNEATEYISSIGNALAVNSELPETFGGYHFLILDSSERNSFCAPGGFIFITRGLLRVLNSEDMVACALAYSISHIVMHSGLQSMSESRRADALSKLSVVAVQNSESEEMRNMNSALGQEVRQVSKMLVLSDLNRKQVMQADIMAIRLAALTGYDPFVFESVLKLLPELSSESKSPKESRFPSRNARIAAVESVLRGTTYSPVGQEYLEARRDRFIRALGSI
jgi:beta-barrel assembly-enhancing protease